MNRSDTVKSPCFFPIQFITDRNSFSIPYLENGQIYKLILTRDIRNKTMYLSELAARVNNFDAVGFLTATHCSCLHNHFTNTAPEIQENVLITNLQFIYNFVCKLESRLSIRLQKKNRPYIQYALLDNKRSEKPTSEDQASYSFCGRNKIIVKKDHQLFFPMIRAKISGKKAISKTFSRLTDYYEITISEQTHQLINLIDNPVVNHRQNKLQVVCRDFCEFCWFRRFLQIKLTCTQQYSTAYSIFIPNSLFIIYYLK